MGLAVGLSDGALSVWDVDRGREIQRTRTSLRGVTALGSAQGGRLTIAGDAGGRLSLTGAVFHTTNENVIFTVDATAIPPLFIKVRDLGLLDTYWGVILPQVAFSLAISILLLRSAFKQLPAELLDAAMMDGCGYFRYFFYITLPLSGPILATVAIVP